MFKKFTFSILSLGLFFVQISTAQDNREISVGWIGPMTGPVAKYAAWEAAQVALEEINESGGIAGKQVKLVAEDARGVPSVAVNAAQKLIHVDKVKYILGGHCSPESVPIAKLTTNAKVIQLAALSSSPKLTGAGEYLFRLTGDIRKLITVLAKYLDQTPQKKKIALLNEETEFTVPESSALRNALNQSKSIEVVYHESFLPGTQDFRPLLLKANSQGIDYLFLGVQATDTAELVMSQIRELKIDAIVLGNTVVAGAARKHGGSLFNGLVAVDSTADPNNEKTNSLVAKLKEKFAIDGLPLGVLTAEAYDSLYLLKYAIETCGEGVEQVRQCLEELTEYQGAVGSLAFDREHNALREYGVGTYRDGSWMKLKKVSSS